MGGITELWTRWKVWSLSILAGTCLGCIYWLFIDFKFLNRGLSSPAWIMTIAFLVFVPLAMGYLSVYRYRYPLLRKTLNGITGSFFHGLQCWSRCSSPCW